MRLYGRLRPFPSPVWLVAARRSYVEVALRPRWGWFLSTVGHKSHSYSRVYVGQSGKTKTEQVGHAVAWSWRRFARAGFLFVAVGVEIVYYELEVYNDEDEDSEPAAALL